MTIQLTDAGARAGELFIYSRFQPVMRSAEGLTVTDINQAGENVWRIGMRDRQHGLPQRIDLSIQLPVIRQWWFWSMTAVMVASMITAAWRYVAWLKLDQKHSLAVERTRIARDLHDDLGANLAEIAMISDLAQEQLPDDDPSRQSLNEIFTRAESNARRLGEIVWAINPANDTLERFAGFLCKFTQDYLALARIGCRLDVPEQLPPLPLNSIQRHNLFLAAKEAIHNAVRHGKPTEITLRISLRGDQVSLAIEDNGCGFDSSDQTNTIRGTRNMRERMDKIGGSLTCLSSFGQGTIVTLTAPLKA
jgi:signal transduction histidine kinase